MYEISLSKVTKIRTFVEEKNQRKRREWCGWGGKKNEHRLDGIGGSEGKSVTAAAMEAVLEVDDLLTLLALSGGDVLANLPIEGALESVLDCESAAADEEDVLHDLGHRDALESCDEPAHLEAVDVTVARVLDGDTSHLLDEFLVRHLRVVVASGPARKVAEEIEVPLSGDAVDQPVPCALIKVNDDVEPVSQHCTRDDTVNLIKAHLLDLFLGQFRSYGGGGHFIWWCCCCFDSIREESF